MNATLAAPVVAGTVPAPNSIRGWAPRAGSASSYGFHYAANVAVVWSGFFNFFGVLASTGAMAFGIASLLPC